MVVGEEMVVARVVEDEGEDWVRRGGAHPPRVEEKAVLINPLAACRKEGRGKLIGEVGVGCTPACNLLVEGVLGGVALMSRNPGTTPEEGPIKGLVRIPVK